MVKESSIKGLLLKIKENINNISNYDDEKQNQILNECFEEIEKLKNTKLSKDIVSFLYSMGEYCKFHRDIISKMIKLSYDVKIEYAQKVQEINEKAKNFESRIKEQVEKEKVDIRGDTCMSLLEIVDNLDMSLDAFNVGNLSMSSIQHGIKTTRDRTVYILAQKGVQAIDVKEGDDYDVNIHKAIDVENKDKASSKMYVKIVIKKGYKIDDKILRPALVIVEKR